MTDELDTALNDLYPVPPANPGAMQGVRDRVLAATATATAATATVAAPPRRRWRPRLPLAAAAAAALVVATAVVVVRGRGPEMAMVEVAQTLNTAADAQIRAVDEPVPAGAYRYIATHSMNTSWGPGSVALMGRRIETWIPADLAGVWYMLDTDTGERVRLLGTEQQNAALNPLREPERLTGRCGAFHPGSPGLCDGAGSWQVPTPAFLAGLPREPHALYERLRADTEGHGRDVEQEVLVYAADALRSGLLPADLRAALYRALTYLPSLEITSRAVTLDGRTGTGLGITAEGVQDEIVVDPATGDFIGEREHLSEIVDGVAASTMTGSSTVTYAVVDEPWQRPGQ